MSEQTVGAPPEGVRPDDYPARWETDVVLGDGGTVHVRPIRPDDVPRLVRFHSRQSAESIYFRYFSHHPRLSERELEHFTNVDYRARMAFVALLGEELIAVARYEPWGQVGQVEAAFFVDDRHHGRGLATLLLEYLAVAAREAGFTVMTASVLASNSGMLAVFKRAGFRSSSAFVDGVVEVRFAIDPSAEADAAVAERERRAGAASVARLLRPRSVAVVGASREPGSVGHDLFVSLLRGGFEGPVHPVNEAAAHVHSVPAYRRIADVPGEVDLAFVAVPADRIAEVVEQCGRKEVGALVVLTDGVPGVALAGNARGWGMRVVGPDALGLVNTDPEVRLHGVPVVEGGALAGRASLSVQSGTLGAAVIAAASDAGIGLSTFVGLGAKADVSGNDLLQFWEQDPRTTVVLQYLESLGNPRRFFRIARRVAQVKPIVVVSTAGWTDEPTWLGPADQAYSALLAQAGVVEVRTLGELFSAARLLASQPLPAGNRVAVVAEAAGPANLAARAARREDLQVIGVEMASGEPIEATLAATLARQDVDAAVVVARVDRRPGVQAAVDTVAQAAGKPVVATWLGLRRQLDPGSGCAHVPLPRGRRPGLGPGLHPRRVAGRRPRAGRGRAPGAAGDGRGGGPRPGPGLPGGDRGGRGHAQPGRRPGAAGPRRGAGRRATLGELAGRGPRRRRGDRLPGGPQGRWPAQGGPHRGNGPRPRPRRPRGPGCLVPADGRRARLGHGPRPGAGHAAGRGRRPARRRYPPAAGPCGGARPGRVVGQPAR
ncbi:MAG: GNAT family N-acetyltransferase [Acidimicrobiia bacterium]|nr:GNAT family N-acetyltransferase [Acidimicrobiia bacterium]